jgi:hypothetical protein
MLVVALSVVSVASATHIPVGSVADNLGAGTTWGAIIDDAGMSGDTQTTADTITNDATDNHYGGGVFNTPISYITFDLGQNYPLDEIWIWNYNHPNLEGNGWRWSDWKDIGIQISPDAGPYDWIASTVVGLADGTPANEVDLVVDGIGGTPTRYIRFHASALPDFNWGGFHNQSILLGEVRFYAHASAFQAGSPDPEDGATFRPINQQLGWSAPLLSVSEPNQLTYCVTFGTDPNLVGGALTDVGLATSHDPGALTNGTTYYWRVDVKDPNGGGPITLTGNIWSFKTESIFNETSNPNPASGATDILKTVTLTWTSDALADSHEVYLRKLNEGPFVLVETIAGPGNESYNPLADGQDVSWATTFEWRVDDVFDEGGPETVPGFVWTFTTAVPTCTGFIGALDQDGDCTVTLVEFAVVSQVWMDCGATPVEACGDLPLP